MKPFLALILLATLAGPSVAFGSSSQKNDEIISKSVTKAENFLQEDTYIIGPGDVLELRLLEDPELGGRIEVLSDGSVSVPMVGTARVVGMTLDQARKHLQELLGEQLLSPELQLQVLQPRPIRVSLLGEVQRPGLYSLMAKGGESSAVEGAVTKLSGLPTVVNAIQAAGGITQSANLRAVTLQRRLPGINLNYKETNLDLLKLIQSGNQLQNPYLFDGDVITLPTAPELPEEAVSLSSVNLSPQSITVNIIGEVYSPGPVALKSNTPLVQAILAAGGPRNWRANKGNVHLVRINRNGSATLRRFRINLAQGASSDKNPPLRDGDTVRVNRSPVAQATDAIGAVSQPLSGLVTVWSLFKLIDN